MTPQPKVDIILPTYNGEPWLDATLESIFQQDFEHWRILVRDDGSTDNTVNKLLHWQQKSNGRMVFLPCSGSGNIGAKYQVPRLLAASSAPYVILAGQDDLWLPDRIKRTLAAFQDAEEQSGQRKPTIVCSDAIVIDKNDTQMAPSFYEWARIDPRRIKKLAHIAMESPGLGAAMAVNKEMIAFALPLEDGFYDADFWLAMVASVFGTLIVLPEPTIYYRRHGANASGNPFGSSILMTAKRFFASPKMARKRLKDVLHNASVPQAGAFIRQYGDRLSPKDVAALAALANLPARGFLARRIAVIVHGLWYASWLKNFGLMIFL